MEKIDKLKVMSNIKIFIFFIYILIFYIFGANSETVKYSEIILIHMEALCEYQDILEWFPMVIDVGL